MTSRAVPLDATRAWSLPGALLLVALAWIGGHFSGYATGTTAQLANVGAHVVLVLVTALAWGACLRAGPSRFGPSALLGVAIFVKVFTVVAVVWALTHPTGFGPHSVLDWLPIGTANAGSGLVLLAYIRTRRAACRPSVTG